MPAILVTLYADCGSYIPVYQCWGASTHCVVRHSDKSSRSAFVKEEKNYNWKKRNLPYCNLRLAELLCH